MVDLRVVGEAPHHLADRLDLLGRTRGQIRHRAMLDLPALAIGLAEEVARIGLLAVSRFDRLDIHSGYIISPCIRLVNRYNIVNGTITGYTICQETGDNPLRALDLARH